MTSSSPTAGSRSEVLSGLCAVAPFAGGWLLLAGSWRWVFLLSPPLAVVVAVIAQRHMPETRDGEAMSRIDVLGSVLGVVGLGGLTAGIIAASDHGLGSARVWGVGSNYRTRDADSPEGGSAGSPTVSGADPPCAVSTP